MSKKYFEETELNLVCPHCSKEMEKILVRKTSTWMTETVVAMCPHCRKPIPVGFDFGH